MRIAVTGGLGFIGTEVISQAIDKGIEVICVDYYETLIQRYEMARLPILDPIYRNLSSCAALVGPQRFIESALFGAQAIVHLGANVDTKDMGTFSLWDNNLRYTEELCRRVSHPEVPLLFASSAATYGIDGHPCNPYGLTKSVGEKMVAAIERGRTSILRFFNVFGKYEHHKGEMASIPWKLDRAYRLGDRLDMHSLEAKRDFISVKSVAEVILSEVDELMGPRKDRPRSMIYDVGTGHSTSFQDLDYYYRQDVLGNNALPSAIREIEFPRDLVGRYQTFTRGGLKATLKGSHRDFRTGLRETYGGQ